MQLNAEASDEERQLLVPFVTRLACADTAEVEARRQAYINSLMPYRISFRQRLDVLDGTLARVCQYFSRSIKRSQVTLSRPPHSQSTNWPQARSQAFQIQSGWDFFEIVPHLVHLDDDGALGGRFETACLDIVGHPADHRVGASRQQSGDTPERQPVPVARIIHEGGGCGASP